MIHNYKKITFSKAGFVPAKTSYTAFAVDQTSQRFFRKLNAENYNWANKETLSINQHLSRV